MVKIAPSYSDEQVLLCVIDAYVNSDLRKYLMGKYPTVRTFYKGKLVKNAFAGNRDEFFVRTFIDSVVASPDGRVALKELKTSKELFQLLEVAQVPVMVKFFSPL